MEERTQGVLSHLADLEFGVLYVRTQDFSNVLQVLGQ
jgi:hypothetical protein